MTEEQQKARRDYEKSYREKNKDKIRAYLSEYRAQNREKLQQYNLDYRNKHPTLDADYYAKNKQALEEKRLKYYTENREYFREYNRQYRQNHKEEMRQHWSEYSKKNREKRRLLNHQYRARKMQCKGSHTNEEWAATLETYGYRCFYCGAGGDLSRDHINPLSRGGNDFIGNIVPSCQPCNSSKGTRSAVSFLIRKFEEKHKP